MNRRSLGLNSTLLLSVVLFAKFAAAQASTAPSAPPATSVAVEVVSSRPNAVNTKLGVAPFEVTLRNVSSRQITAWNFAAVGRYADGSSRSTAGGVDIVSSLLSRDSSERFSAGSTRSFSVSLPLGTSGDAPLTLDITLPLVVFDDGNAIGDSTAIGRLAAGRKSMATQMEPDLADLDAAVRAPDLKAALTNAIASRSRRNTSTPTGGAGGSGILRQAMGLVGGGRPALDSLITYLNAYHALLLQHSTIAEVK